MAMAKRGLKVMDKKEILLSPTFSLIGPPIRCYNIDMNIKVTGGGECE
jgi:hypothetical protein